MNSDYSTCGLSIPSVFYGDGSRPAVVVRTGWSSGLALHMCSTAKINWATLRQSTSIEKTNTSAIPEAVVVNYFWSATAILKNC